MQIGVNKYIQYRVVIVVRTYIRSHPALSQIDSQPQLNYHPSVLPKRHVLASAPIDCSALSASGVPRSIPLRTKRVQSRE